ncbi:class I SAM-dependent methyltransferase [Rhodococcus sp. NPDC058521]|uniref:class I SAM-dependent methyltransferase n=1 Tax=Rhodococcus sp. NPDC058521 TaxID=3346536 RepID=UPI00365E73D8
MDARAWDDRYSQDEFVWGAPPNDVVVEQLTALPHGRALDLACGEGRNSLWLATRGWQVTGIDYSGVAVEKARAVASRSPRSVRERLDYRVADITDCELGEGYDVALLIYVHLPRSQRQHIVKRAINSLKPDGILMILGHDSSNIENGVGGPQDLEILYTPDELRSELPSDFLVDVTERRLRETEAGIAIDALVVGRRPSLGTQMNRA